MKNTLSASFASNGYGYRRELSVPDRGFFDSPFFFRGASSSYPQEQKVMHGLCGVWFFHALDHTFQLSQSRAFISRINLAAVSELKIIPDPLYDGKASIIARPLPAGYEKNSHFIEECTLPYGSVEVWNGSAWIPKEAITDGGNAIDNLIRAKAYIHPLEQIHGSRTDVIKFLYPQQKIR